MSSEFLRGQNLESIKQSQYKRSEKVINVWNPLTIGTAFPATVIMQKKKYTRGEIPDRLVVPPVVAQLDGGIIIDLPDENIEEYLQDKVDLQVMPSDEDLINYLEDQIDDHQNRKKNSSDDPAGDPSKKLSAISLVELPGLSSIDTTRKEMIRKKFQDILDRPTRSSFSRSNQLDQLQYQVSHEKKYDGKEIALPTYKRSIAGRIDKESEVARLYF